MKPSQPIWDPLKYYPSSYYRYLTAEKMVTDRQGKFNYSSAVETFSLTDWWDGKKWHLDDPWSTNTISRFCPDVATLYSAIAVPADHKVSICTGNPGMPYWGILAGGQSGTYVNFTTGSRQEDLVFNLKKDASAAMWKTVRAMGNEPPQKEQPICGRRRKTITGKRSGGLTGQCWRKRVLQRQQPGEERQPTLQE